MDSQTISLPLLCITGNACCGCFNVGPKFACSKCQRARYCSAECQRENWNKHKVNCKQLTFIDKVDGLTFEKTCNSNIEWFGQCQRRIALYAQNLLGNQEKIDTEDLPAFFEQTQDIRILDVDNFVFFEPKCSKCFKVKPKNENLGINFFNCKVCNWGVVCKDCKEDYIHSEDLCNKYKFVNEMDTFYSNFILEKKKIPAVVSLLPRKVEKKVLELTPEFTWENYFEAREFSSQLRIQEKAFISRKLTQVVTAFKALQVLYTVKQLMAMETLTIHVVGASEDDGVPNGYWEELSHVIPNLRELLVVLIGPDLKALYDDEVFNKKTILPTCSDCSTRKRQTNYKFINDVYHNYVGDTSSFETPDLVIAFNSGIHEAEQDTWLPTLLTFQDIKAKLCFTSFNQEEARKDERVLRALGYDVVQPAQENPFQSLVVRPEQNTIDKFYTQNYFFIVAKGVGELPF